VTLLPRGDDPPGLPSVLDLVDGGFVDRRIYRDPWILQWEKDLIFARTWHYACTVHDLRGPGDYYTLTVADEPVLVVADRDGRPRAYYNACPHRGAALVGDSSGNCGRVLRCMYHGWAFNLDGDLVAVPYAEGYGESLDRAAFGLVPVHCETFYDLVFVALDPVVPSLREYLGSFAERLGPYVDGIEPIGRNSWIYDGNWKIWHENFRDNYHPEFTHRLIHDLTPHYADAGGNWGFDEGHSVLQWAGPGASSPDRYLRSLRRYSGVHIEAIDAPVERTSRKGTPDEVLAVFPNADFQPRATADARGLKAGFIQTVTPLGVDQARVDLTVYSSIHDDQATRQHMLENVADTQGPWGKISTDDTEAACRVQIGMYALGARRNIYTRGTAPGNGGPDAQSRDEYSQRAFFRAYMRYLTWPDDGRSQLRRATRNSMTTKRH
jgi:phenylpropionate dioxygenase-like ring-hydroxylating dioxygenase large terminal subunit